jgi:alpha-N-arabinofuranosidase
VNLILSAGPETRLEKNMRLRLRGIGQGLTVVGFVFATTVLRAAEVAGTIHVDEAGPTISRYLYGHFLEHLGRAVYDGVWVGPDSPIPNTGGLRDDVVAALKALQIPVIRWPGGCYADEYHWQTGIGAPEDRPVTINMSWGGVEETNAFGTHEFFALLEATGADAYVAGNLGTGSAREMVEWLEYMTSPSRSTLAEERRANGRDEPFRVPFFGVGNESWGCGGQMTPAYYVNLYKQTAEFLEARGQRLLKIASGGYDARTDWTEALSQIGQNIDGISHHYYTVPTGVWARKGNATGFPEEQWISTLARALRVESHIAAQEAVLAANDPQNRIGIYLDEWGTWYDPTPGASALWQQNTLRDAMVAALHFHVFHRHAGRVRMANIAQTVNVLQAMILTEGERMVLTPTYHVFEMYIPFQDSTFIPVRLTEELPPYSLGEYSVPSVSATAARGTDGRLHVSLANLHPDEPAEVTLVIEGAAARVVAAEILTAPRMDSHNSFDAPDQVAPRDFDQATVSGGMLRVDLPAKSIVMIALQ